MRNIMNSLSTTAQLRNLLLHLQSYIAVYDSLDHETSERITVLGMHRETLGYQVYSIHRQIDRLRSSAGAYDDLLNDTLDAIYAKNERACDAILMEKHLEQGGCKDDFDAFRERVLSNPSGMLDENTISRLKALGT